MYRITKAEVTRTLAQYNIRTINDMIPPHISDFIRNAVLDALTPHKQELAIDNATALDELKGYFAGAKKLTPEQFFEWMKEFGYTLKQPLKETEDGTEGKCIN